MTMYIIHAVVLVSILLWLCYTDWRTQIIPDFVHILLIVYALIVLPIDYLDSLTGFLVGFMLMFIVSMFGPTGGGDIKLMGSLGTWFSWQIIDVFLLSYIVGLIYVGFFYIKSRDSKQEVPFGPAIAIAAFLIYFTEVSLLYKEVFT